MFRNCSLCFRSILASKTITPTYLKPINTAEDLLLSQLKAFCTPDGCDNLYTMSTWKEMKNRIDPGLLDSLQENIKRFTNSRNTTEQRASMHLQSNAIAALCMAFYLQH